MCLHSHKLAICTTLQQRAPAGYPPSHRTATVSVLAAVPAWCNPAECHSSTFWEQISPVSPNTYTHEDCSVAACLTGSPDCSVTSPLQRRSMCVWCPICNEQNTKRSLRCSDCGSPLHGEGYAAPKSLDLVNPAHSNHRGPGNRTRSNRRSEDLKTITHKGGTVVDQHHVCTPPQTQPSACLLSSLPELRLHASLVRARQEDISSLRRRMRVVPETQNTTGWTSSEQRGPPVNGLDNAIRSPQHSPIHRFDRQLSDELSLTGADLRIDGSHITPLSGMRPVSGNCEMRILEDPVFECNNNPRDSIITCA